MVLDAAQERICVVASGATTRTRAPVSRRLAILDSAIVPAPTTRHWRAASLRNIGKSLGGFMLSRRALLSEAWTPSLSQIRPVIELRFKQKAQRILDLRETIRGQQSGHFEDALIVVALSELRGRGIVDDESHVGMELQCGGGDRGGDRPFDGLRDGSGLGSASGEQEDLA